jgi:hypothetical protein
MHRRGISVCAINASILGSVLLVYPISATAQRHGGGGGSAGGGGLSGISRPDGVAEKDSLKDFHRAMAMQATSPQIADFQALIKDTEAAQASLQSIRQQLRAENAAPETARTTLNQAIEKARSETTKFPDSFSSAQKAGLKDVLKRLAKADSTLEQEEKSLDQALDLKAAIPQVTATVESLDKALTDFNDQQLALGREMSITLATGQDVAFALPPIKIPLKIENRTISLTSSGELSQIAAQGGKRTFKLETIADLSDLQQNISAILRAQLETSQTCGQRLAIREATLTPANPASLLVLRLHFERWMCARTTGQQIATELAEDDGTVEIKLTAAVESAQSSPRMVKIAAAFGRIDASGMLAESLRSGSLGDDLCDKVAELVQSAARAGSDFKITIPPAVQNSAIVHSAKFQEMGVGGLSLALDGRVEISNAQADQLASQLNQTLSAQGPPAPLGTAPHPDK